MRARTLILLFIAVLLAGGTTVLARAWLAAQREATRAEAAPMALPAPARSVLVARNGIQRGQIMKADDFAWQPWPEGGVDKNYVVIGTRTPDSFVGSVARHPLSAGEPITDAKLVAPGSRGFLAAVLRPGMRAVSVPVTVTSGISGFIFPGDDVDILITYGLPGVSSSANTVTSGNSQYEHKATETVLHGVRVIAIDQRLETKAGEAVVAHTATLEVSPKDCEVIALASEIGRLSLSLRSLVPGVSDPPASLLAGADSGAGVASATYTIDSEVSPLLPKALIGRGNHESIGVTILRGGGKAGDSAASQPASRGS